MLIGILIFLFGGSLIALYILWKQNILRKYMSIKYQICEHTNLPNNTEYANVIF